MKRTSEATKGVYSATNPIRTGLKCMVFTDKAKDKHPQDTGSRYFFGVIVEVYGEVVTVKVTESTWSRWKVHDQIWFRKDQIWAFTDPRVMCEQLMIEF